jgi:uncharacterized protein YaaN involved in tellurite resistance
MKLAILYQDDEVFVQFEEEQFRKLFKLYFDKYQDIDKALDAIIADLRRQQMST